MGRSRFTGRRRDVCRDAAMPGCLLGSFVPLGAPAQTTVGPGNYATTFNVASGTTTVVGNATIATTGADPVVLVSGGTLVVDMQAGPQPGTICLGAVNGNGLFATGGTVNVLRGINVFTTGGHAVIANGANSVVNLTGGNLGTTGVGAGLAVNRQEHVMTRPRILSALVSLSVACSAGMPVAHGQSAPNMPAKNPWLAESVYPTSHFNPAATDSVLIAGPVTGKHLTKDDVKTVPTLITSNPTMKRLGTDVVAFASGAVGVQKILVTGNAFEAIGPLQPYPGFEASAQKATPATLARSVASLDAAYRVKDEKAILGGLRTLGDAGLNTQSGINGVYNLFDKDGFHYCVFGGTKVLKSTDDNVARGPVKTVKTADIASALPAHVAKSVTRIIGLNMTYDGYLAAAAPGALVVLDRDLNVMSYVVFGDEAVDNSIVIDEKNGIYVVTSKRMLKVIWNGKTLSTDEKDGAWSSEYDSMPGDKALALGAISRGSGTTPSLMGFGDDPDKLVVIADAAEAGTNAVAFWRDAIPTNFKQKPGTKSRRIADQTRIDISRLTIEPSPNVLGYGVTFLNSTYPKPLPAGFGNGFTGGRHASRSDGRREIHMGPLHACV